MPKPQYNPTHMLREFVKEQGYDPGPAPENNADPDLVMVYPGSNPPGGIPSRTDPTDGGHPSIGSAGSPAMPPHSKRTSGADPTPGMPGA